MQGLEAIGRGMEAIAQSIERYNVIWQQQLEQDGYRIQIPSNRQRDREERRGQEEHQRDRRGNQDRRQGERRGQHDRHDRDRRSGSRGSRGSGGRSAHR